VSTAGTASASVSVSSSSRAGAGTAFAGVSRFAAAPAGGAQLLGQEVAVLLSVAALAAVALGVGLAGREGRR
jgi:hypothetical protein